MIGSILWGIVGGGVALYLVSGFRVVRPIELALVETFGAYRRTVGQGLTYIFPGIQRLIKVNVTEQMVDLDEQQVITRDKLNCKVDAVVYFQIADVKKATYNADDVLAQLVKLASTTLRAVIGKLDLTEANENRAKINLDIEDVLTKEIKNYGLTILRVELQKIDPPDDVQDAMNEVIKAEQMKIAAVNQATAVETRADGERRAAIKVAEGNRQAAILHAQGQAQAVVLRAEADAKQIQLVNEAAEKYFVGNAQKLKAYDVTATSLATNSKFVIDSQSTVAQLITDISGVPLLPVGTAKTPAKRGAAEASA